MNECSRLCLFEIFVDKIMIHVEQTQTDQLKHKVKSVAQSYCFVICFPEL